MDDGITAYRLHPEEEIVYRNEKNELSIHKLKKRQNMY